MAGDFLRLARRCATCGRWLILRRQCRSCADALAFSAEAAEAMAAWRRGDPPPIREAGR